MPGLKQIWVDYLTAEVEAESIIPYVEEFPMPAEESSAWERKEAERWLKECRAKTVRVLAECIERARSAEKEVLELRAEVRILECELGEAGLRKWSDPSRWPNR